MCFINSFQEEGKISSLVSNGCVDYKGQAADKQRTGGWKASPFIIGTKLASLVYCDLLQF